MSSRTDSTMDVLVDQLDGLRAKGVPEQLAVAARWLHRLVDLRQPPVVGLGRGSGTGPATAPPRWCRAREYSAANLSRISLFGRHCCAAHQALVAAHGAVHASEERQTLLHLHGQCLAQLVDVATRPAARPSRRSPAPGRRRRRCRCSPRSGRASSPGRRCGWCGRWPAEGCGPSSACRDTSPAGSARRSRSAALR